MWPFWGEPFLCFVRHPICVLPSTVRCFTRAPPMSPPGGSPFPFFTLPVPFRSHSHVSCATLCLSYWKKRAAATPPTREYPEKRHTIKKKKKKRREERRRQGMMVGAPSYPPREGGPPKRMPTEGHPSHTLCIPTNAWAHGTIAPPLLRPSIRPKRGDVRPGVRAIGALRTRDRGRLSPMSIQTESPPPLT